MILYLMCHHVSSASLALVTGECPHKGPVTRKMFPFDDVTMIWQNVPMHETTEQYPMLINFRKCRWYNYLYWMGSIEIHIDKWPLFHCYLFIISRKKIVSKCCPFLILQSGTTSSVTSLEDTSAKRIKVYFKAYSFAHKWGQCARSRSHG